MPRGDRTGPSGLGSMTGRDAGFCASYPVPGYMNPAFGWRLLCRRGGFIGRGRRGRRNWYWATGLTGWQRAALQLPAFGGWVNPFGYPSSEFTPEQEADILRRQAEILKKDLEDIQSRIEALERLKSQHDQKEE